jgi:hypothetical protein
MRSRGVSLPALWPLIGGDQARRGLLDKLCYWTEPTDLRKLEAALSRGCCLRRRQRGGRVVVEMKRPRS